MDSRDQRPQRRENASFPDIIGAKARRKLKAKGEQHRSIWFGMDFLPFVNPHLEIFYPIMGISYPQYLRLAS
jgi:hypothetical protein